jgi:hypothetical protein
MVRIAIVKTEFSACFSIPRADWRSKFDIRSAGSGRKSMSKLNDFVSGFEFVFHQPAQRRWETCKLAFIFVWYTHVQSVQ